MTTNTLRRKLCMGVVVTPFFTHAIADQKLPTVDVWKSPSCGCCGDWIKHMEQNGFSVRAHNTGNNAVRQRLGMPLRLASCHTARVGRYVVEGHVPAKDVIRLLKEDPDAVGISVPQMPVGSPGMDGPVYRGRKDPYDVLLVDNKGSTSVFASYR